VKHIGLNRTSTAAAMSLQTIQAYQEAAAARPPDDESDAEEDTLVNDYKEQMQYDHQPPEDFERTAVSGPAVGQDIREKLAAAAEPLEYQATLETKLASYDMYCSLFHFILNSDGPVPLEMPSVSSSFVDGGV
jgi:translation initiation factor 3 subunit L